MCLISKEVEVDAIGRNIKYYESLGYEIPKYKDKQGKIVVKLGTKIMVKVEDLSQYSHVKVKVKCDECGKEYDTEYKNYIKRNHDGKVYCTKCKSKVLNSGENHPCWRHDKTQEEREIQRKYPEYIEFVKKVFARDNYTCKCCGKKIDGNMVVHHLNSYDNFKDQRTDVTNGITLCKTCHSNFHMKYGYGNNTKEQFEEWYGQTVELLKYDGELSTTRKIYCIEEDKIYDGACQLANEWGCVNTNIYGVCNRKTKAGKAVKNKHIVWLDEWQLWNDIQKEEWKQFVFRNKRKRQIICIETGIIYESATEIERQTGISHSNITGVCRGRRETCGGYHWKYYEEYLKQYNIKDLDNVN